MKEGSGKRTEEWRLWRLSGVSKSAVSAGPENFAPVLSHCLGDEPAGSACEWVRAAFGRAVALFWWARLQPVSCQSPPHVCPPEAGGLFVCSSVRQSKWPSSVVPDIDNRYRYYLDLGHSSF